jgi:hypothetical protein
VTAPIGYLILSARICFLAAIDLAAIDPAAIDPAAEL